MIILNEENSVAVPSYFLDRLRKITVMPYRRLSVGYTHTHELKEKPDFRLMEGTVVPMHSDGIPGYRPILMLENPGQSYIIKGAKQKFLPQKVGTLIILDIDSQHEVRRKDPNNKLGPWSGMVWGVGATPLLKAEWSPKEVANRAKKEFSEFINQS